MTGLTFMAAELNAKRLEILRDTVPRFQRVAIIANPEHPGSQIERTYSETDSPETWFDDGILWDRDRGPTSLRIHRYGPEALRKRSRFLPTALPFSIASGSLTTE